MRQRENIILNHILGQDNNTNPELLRDGFVQDITNMVIDSVGNQYKLKQRNGMSIFNSNTLGSTATKCLYDLISQSGANYMVGGTGTVLAKSLNGTGAWANIKTGLTEPRVNIHPYAGNFYCTNGAEAPFVFGGDDFSSLWDLGIERPTGVTSITHTHQAVGGLDTTARYKYVLVYVTESGERSRPSRPFSIWTGANQKATFFNLPTPTDTRVTQKILFRTFGSEDNYYRLYPKNATTGTVVDMLSASEGSFIDDIPDTDLDQADTIDFTSIPNYAKSIAIHKERIFLGNIARTDKALIEPSYDPDRVVAQYNSVEGHIIPDVEYRVRICYMDSTGAYSDYEDFTVYVESPNNAISIVAPPKMSTKFAQGIEKILIFRSLSGSATLKLSESIDADNPTDPVILTKADGDLGTTFPSYPVVKQSSAIVFSEISKLNEIPLINNILVNPDDGDEITAIYDDEEGLLVFKKYSIWKIYTTGSPQNWQVERVFTDLGVNHWTHICKNGREYVLYYQRQIYLMQGTNYAIISEPVKKNISEEGKSFNCIIYDPKNNWYIIPVIEDIVPPGTTKIMIYHRELKCWYKFTSGVWGSSEFANTVAIKRYGTYANSIIIADGKLKRYDSAVSTDASSSTTVAISPSFKTKVYYLGDGFNKSIIRELTVIGEGTISTEIYSGASNISGSLTLTNNVPYSLNLLTQKISIVIGCTYFDSLKLSYRKVLRGKQQ